MKVLWPAPLARRGVFPPAQAQCVIMNNSTLKLNTHPNSLHVPCDTISQRRLAALHHCRARRERARSAPAGSLIGPQRIGPSIAPLGEINMDFRSWYRRPPLSRRRVCRLASFADAALPDDNAFIVHNHHHRNFVVRRGPKRARRVHQSPSPSPSMETVIMPFHDWRVPRDGRRGGLARTAPPTRQ